MGAFGRAGLNTKHLRVALLLLSVALYLISLTQMVLPGYPGWFILLVGWTTISFSVANFTWIANIFLFVAWMGIIESGRVFAVRFALGAVAVAGTFLACHTVVTGEDGGGHPIHYLPGYWLWLASMVCAYLGTLSVSLRDTPNESA